MFLAIQKKCVCSKWSCIDEIDFAKLQEENQKLSMSNDQFDEKFRCWKNCCKKQGESDTFGFGFLLFWKIDQN